MRPEELEEELGLIRQEMCREIPQTVAFGAAAALIRAAVDPQYVGPMMRWAETLEPSKFIRYEEHEGEVEIQMNLRWMMEDALRYFEQHVRE